jgi:hypothetical protein
VRKTGTPQFQTQISSLIGSKYHYIILYHQIVHVVSPPVGPRVSISSLFQWPFQEPKFFGGTLDIIDILGSWNPGIPIDCFNLPKDQS